VIGTTVGHYHLVEELGRGGFATVYKAYQPALKRYVAIKLMDMALGVDEQAVRRFQREARAIAALRHPNIIAVYDFGDENGQAYLVMELVDGPTLKSKLGRPLPAREVVTIVRAVAAALDYAHQNGVIHRDVKPGNVLLDRSGRILLSDFGIAQVAESSITLTRGIVGTPQYMSPEQALGKRVDARSDTYSLAAMVYEMLVGQVPYRGDTPVATLSMHVNAPVPSPRAVNPALSEALEQVLVKGLSKDPAARYASAGELAEALARASGDAAPSAPPPDAEPMTMLYNQLQRARQRSDWASAAELCARLLAVDRQFRDVPEILAEVSRQLRLGGSPERASAAFRQFRARAQEAYAEERWGDAAYLFNEALKLAPRGHDPAQLAEVHRLAEDAELRAAVRSKLVRLYATAVERVEVGDGRWALNICDEISQIDPRYPGIEELRARARGLLSRAEIAAQRARQAAELRQQAATARATGHWTEALDHLERARKLAPDDPTLAAELEEARRAVQLQRLNAEAAALTASGRFQEAIAKLEEARALDPHGRFR